jgi:hypothetical protein
MLVDQSIFICWRRHRFTRAGRFRRRHRNQSSLRASKGHAGSRNGKISCVSSLRSLRFR